MAEVIEQKFKILQKAFLDLGWDLQKDIDQNEIIQFLNNRTKNGQIDNNLLNKLLQFIEIEEDTKITVEDFINQFIQFEEELNNKNNEIKDKIIDEQSSYNSYQEECYKYKNEKLNADGFSDNAKLNIEITDIEIKKNLRNIKEIILYLIYNNQKEEISFDYTNNIINFNDKYFEFKSLSKKDKFELILKGVKNNEDNEIVEIGKKIFPLEELVSQEEYTVQITIPEKGNQGKDIAFINSKITLHWSDYKYFEEKKKNCENKIRKLNESSLKLNTFLMKIKEIYGLRLNNLNNFNTEQTQATKENGFPYDTKFGNTESFSEKDINNQKTKERQSKLNNIYENNENNQFGIGYEQVKSGYELNINNVKTRNRNSYKNLKGIWLIKLLSLLCVLFGLFNSLQRADYPSEIVGLICFWYIYFVEKNNLAVKSKNFWNLFLLVFVALIYDCIWLYINVGFLGPIKITAGEYDSAIKRLSYFTTGCNSIIKCCLAILMFAQYKLNY